jgi:hypothetical protein
MSALKPRRWQIRWFSVDNPVLMAEEQPQGIFLSAMNRGHVQERYILISPSGTQQAFILDRGANAKGIQAHELFQQAIQSQRVSEQLGSGRAWINRELAGAKLDRILKEKDPIRFVSDLTEIQALLLAKISVDPATYDSYYHLGGTALMLAKFAKSQHNSEWSAAAVPMVESAYRYAQDVQPRDPRTAQLQNMALEVKGY